MKRKALAAIMAVAMAVSMAGCGGSRESRTMAGLITTLLLLHRI